MRFTLVTLFLGMTIVAFACVALTKPSLPWTVFFHSLAMLSVIGAAVGGVTWLGPPRAFCRGFALAGILYVILVHWPGFSEDFFITGFAFTYLNRTIFGLQGRDYVDSSLDDDTAYTYTTLGHFVLTTHCLSTLIVAVFGGCLGLYFDSVRKRAVPN